MKPEFQIEETLVTSPDEFWMTTRREESFDENMALVIETKTLTGHQALAHEAIELIKEYEAHCEANKQRLMALARNLLSGAEVN